MHTHSIRYLTFDLVVFVSVLAVDVCGCDGRRTVSPNPHSYVLPAAPLNNSPITHRLLITDVFHWVDGMVVDELGRKMSKSIGNVIVPSDIIDGTAGSAGATASTAPTATAAAAATKTDKKQKKAKAGGAAGSVGNAVYPAHGVDVLRLWVAGTDYSRDISIGPKTIESTAETLRVIRSAARFMLGCLDDYSDEYVFSSVAHSKSG